jgi:hypothetical protein
MLIVYYFHQDKTKEKEMGELIRAASIARVTDKSGKFLGFLVQSNHHDDIYYQVTCGKVAGQCLWHCTCKAGKFGQVCCHVKACQELCEARKALEQKAAVAEVERLLAAERQVRKAAEDEKEEKVCGEPFPGRRTTGRKRARAFTGFERDLAPLGPQTGFSLMA